VIKLASGPPTGHLEGEDSELELHGTRNDRPGPHHCGGPSHDDCGHKTGPKAATVSSFNDLIIICKMKSIQRKSWIHIDSND